MTSAVVTRDTSAVPGVDETYAVFVHLNAEKSPLYRAILSVRDEENTHGRRVSGVYQWSSGVGASARSVPLLIGLRVRIGLD